MYSPHRLEHANLRITPMIAISCSVQWLFRHAPANASGRASLQEFDELKVSISCPWRLA
jgi:hypothetical protein